MSDTSLYEVILVPAGTPLWAASETREFTLSLDGDVQWSALDSMMVEHVKEQQILDEWAFRQHWETALLMRQDGSPQQRLKDALRSCTTQVMADETKYRFSVQTATKPMRWTQTTLVLDAEKAQEVAEWESEMKQRYPITLYMEDRCLHEAMLRAVSTIEPTVASRFKTDPREAHHNFVDVAMSYGKVVADELKSVEP